MPRDEHLRTHITLGTLCVSIQRFIEADAEDAVYRAPIIDYHHPNDYGQKGITGLRKFLSHAEAERDYLTGVSRCRYCSRTAVIAFR